jgi:hypothetical protein
MHDISKADLKNPTRINRPNQIADQPFTDHFTLASKKPTSKKPTSKIADQ